MSNAGRGASTKRGLGFKPWRHRSCRSLAQLLVPPVALLALALVAACESTPNGAESPPAEPSPPEEARPSGAASGANASQSEWRRGSGSKPAPREAPASPQFLNDPDLPTPTLWLTTHGASGEQPLPWIVGLHGLGDRPESFAHLFKRLPLPVHVYVPQALKPRGKGFDWFGVRVSGDQEQFAKAVDHAASQVSQLLTVLQERPQNQGKPIVTGFSQGGILSFTLAVQHPEQIVAALPIGGWLPPPLWPADESQHGVPIVAFHGERDTIVPFEPTRQAVGHLKQRGFEVALHAYPDLKHTIGRQLRAAWVEELRRFSAAR